jgi:hypothetical protein
MAGLVHVPRWRAFLQRHFDAKGPSEPLQVLDDVLPTVNIYDRDPEVAWHLGERRCLLRVQVTNTAVNSAKVFLANPPTSGGLVVVEDLGFSGGAAAAVNWRVGTNRTSDVAGGVGANLGTVFVVGLDHREVAGGPVASAVLAVPTARVDAVGASYAFLQEVFMSLGINVNLPPLGLVLPPGYCLVLEFRTLAAIDAFAWVTFRERPALERGELAR